MELRIRLRPEVRAFFGLEGPALAVHRFRYVRADGHDACLLICGACGHMVHVAEEECGPIATAPCRRCGEGLSVSPCPRWHNWGRCLSCDEGPVFEAAGLALAAVGDGSAAERISLGRAYGKPASGRLAPDYYGPAYRSDEAQS